MQPNKDSYSYKFVKYNIYKPIRNYLCHYGYREWESEYCINERIKFVKKVKENV